VFAVVASVAVLSAAGFLVYLETSLNRVDALVPWAGRPNDSAGVNWLLVGSDARPAGQPGDELGERADTIMLVHLPSGDEPPTLVSLPRDSYVPIPGYASGKLNSAFSYGGAQLLAQTVELVTGLRIHHYAQVNFAGFAEMADAVGGVRMCLPEPMIDPLANIDLPEGCQKLNGEESLGFVRSRATAAADIDRMARQREFISQLLDTAMSPAVLLNPYRVYKLSVAVTHALTVDSGTRTWNLVSLARALGSGNVVATAVPIAGFEDTEVGNVVRWNRELALPFFGYLAADQSIPAELLTR
jgi:LCP family protein required for cell wall assembly